MANQWIWGARADNAGFLARYSPSGLVPGIAYSTSAGAIPVYEADAAAIGGFRWNMGTSGALIRSLTYPGRGIFNTKTISIVFRARVLASALIGMWDIGNGCALQNNRLALYQNSSAWKSFVTDKNGQVSQSNLLLSTTAPTTTVYQDFVYTWDGTTTANKVGWWIDAVNVGNATASFPWANPQDPTLTDFINIGSVFGGVSNVQMYFSEMAIANYIIDPTAVLTDGGIVSLNGASRTNFITIAQYDGTAVTGGSSKNHLGKSRIG
jgi:hypothetical protein